MISSQLLITLSDLVYFFDRMKVSGEMEALRWTLEKFGQP